MLQHRLFLATPLLIAGLALAQGPSKPSPATTSISPSLRPSTMRVLGTVDKRFQSYNIEMVEVMGGKWWAPYGPATPATRIPSSESNSLGAASFRYQGPIDLANPQLRRLASALSPAYVRVSDTWANTMFFQSTNATVAGPVPAGFGAVLTGPEWRGVIDFSKAIDAKIVTSFSIGGGVRDENGVWTSVEAAKMLNFTRDAGGTIAAAEFFNEPNMAAVEGAPRGYDAAAYGRDFKVFQAFIRSADPALIILGPGPVGEGRVLNQMPTGIKTEDMLKAEGPGLDALSYHFYGAVSERCKSMGPQFQTTPQAALSRKWLFATDTEASFYSKLRDRYEPGKPLWLSETAEAACGGNSWAADFIDSFRYLNQLGTLAQAGVKVVMHNTLTGSDYGLIDESTLIPRPNYWAAVLWHRVMGTIVLDPGIQPVPNLYLYAHCLVGHPGGVGLLAINTDSLASQSLNLPVASERYVMSAKNLMGDEVQLNGTTLELTRNGDLPALEGLSSPAGTSLFAPTSITFVAMPNAQNPSCN